MKILIVEDEPKLATLMQDYLTAAGHTSLCLDNGLHVVPAVRAHDPKLILLDLMMPNMDGYQFLPALRRESHVPVIIITAKDEETDAVLGLELGADDYVIKPFRMRELNARIRANLRRHDIPVEPTEFLRNGELTLDRQSRLVMHGDQKIELTPIEFDLLSVLMRAPGRVYSRQELVEALSESGFAGMESTLNVHMRNLRLKIEPDPSNPIYLETVFGVGYRMNKQEQA